MSRSYRTTLVACGCLCVAVVNQHFRIGELEARLAPSDSSKATASTAPYAADTVPTSAEAMGRLAALERRLGAMQRQLALGAAPAETIHGAIEPWADDVAGDESEDSATGAGAEPEVGFLGDESVSEQKRERLRDMIREEQEAVFEQQRNERWKRRQDRRDADLRDFAERAEISDSQLEEMMSFINQGREQVRSLFDAAHAGDLDYREARDSARGLRGQIDLQIKDVLDEEQYAAYIEYREEERAQRRR